LKNPKEAAAYIEAAIEENDQGVLMLALRQVAMARIGVATILQLSVKPISRAKAMARKAG